MKGCAARICDSSEQAVDLRLEAVIEHVADYRHATRHPLPGTAQFGMIKLRHRAVADHEGLQQLHHRVDTDSVALSQVVYFLQALVG